MGLGQRGPRPRLRIERERRGWSQERLAQELHFHCGRMVSPSTISRWEHGEVPKPLYRELLCEIFDLDTYELELVELPAADPSPRDSRSQQVLAAVQQVFEGWSDDLRRRELLRLVGGQGPAPVLPTDPDSLAWSVQNPRRINGRQLDGLQALTTSLGQMQDTVAPSALSTPVRAHLESVTTLLGGVQPESTHRRLCTVAGETALIAGWLSFHTDNYADARGHFNIAHTAAHQAGDSSLQAHALGAKRALCSAVPLGGCPTTGDTAAALALLDEAIAVAGPAAPAPLRAWLAACKAEDHAVDGNATECYEALQRSQDATDQVQPDERVGRFRHWDNARLDGYRGLCQVLLGAEEAESTLQRALQGIHPARFEHRSAVLTDLAAAYARRGEPEEACRTAIEALTLAADANLGTRLRRIRGVRQRLDAWRHLPAVRDLTHRLAAA